MSRRVPSQQRSKEKYEQVLLSAKELIGQKGNDLVTMREISKHSGVTLPSIYQYFPDKTAILQAIMEDYFSQVRETLVTLLKDCDSMQVLSEQLNSGIDIFYALVKDEPVVSVLWASLQASVSLRELDAKDSAINAGIITDKIFSIIGELRKDEIRTSVILLVNMIGATVRLAATMPEQQGEAIIEEYKYIASLRLKSFSEIKTR